MPASLNPLSRIPTMLRHTAVVKRHLGSGGQGEVYEIYYNGERKALKWYPQVSSKDLEVLIPSLKRNIKRGSPTPEFLWPLDLADFYQGGFGYVMDLRPNGYYEVSDFMLNKAVFPSYRQVIDACLNIVSAFRILHLQGYAYQDVNSKNFFIHPQTGKVLICDNDNVVPSGADTGMRGTWGFMAPEIVRGGNPNAVSDMHSMAVLIFMLLFKVHPLEGMITYDSILNDDERFRIYGEEPCFVFDPDNTANSLNPETHAMTISMWEQMPDHLRRLFIKAFSQQALHTGRGRPIDAEWTISLARLRSEIVACPCGKSEMVVLDGKPARCDSCGNLVSPELMLNLGPFARYSLPVDADTRIYACQIRISNPRNVLDPVAQVVIADDGSRHVELRNMTDSPWMVKKDGEFAAEVPGGGSVRLEDGVYIDGYGGVHMRCYRSENLSNKI